MCMVVVASVCAVYVYVHGNCVCVRLCVVPCVLCLWLVCVLCVCEYLSLIHI